MKVRRPATMEEYIELVDQAVFEASDLRASIEYDVEDMGEAGGFAVELEEQLKALLASLKDGRYEFSKSDLPFMSLVNNVNDMMLPFKHLLRQINNTHTSGLEQ